MTLIQYPRRSPVRLSLHFITALILGLGIFTIALTGTCFAQGNLQLMPRRVVFEGSKRYEELNLANNGRDTARYVISLMHIRMKEDGSFEEIQQPGPGENFADKYLRFFPHSVVLGPTESQVIKIQLTNTNEMAPGEFRSHIYFRAVPPAMPQGEKNTDTSTDSAISIHLVPVFGISIPVIVRVGEPTVKVSLSDLSLEMGEDSIPMLNMSFHRSGNISIYGDIEMYYTPLRGKTMYAGAARGIAIYTPNLLRRFRARLQNMPGFDCHSGRLHVTFSTPPENHAEKIAEAELVLH